MGQEEYDTVADQDEMRRFVNKLGKAILCRSLILGARGLEPLGVEAVDTVMHAATMQHLFFRISIATRCHCDVLE